MYRPGTAIALLVGTIELLVAVIFSYLAAGSLEVGNEYVAIIFTAFAVLAALCAGWYYSLIIMAWMKGKDH